jgi:cyanate lyase
MRTRVIAPSERHPLRSLVHLLGGSWLFVKKSDEGVTRPDPKGDRVKVTMHGKFLPYRKW